MSVDYACTVGIVPGLKRIRRNLLSSPTYGNGKLGMRVVRKCAYNATVEITRQLNWVRRSTRIEDDYAHDDGDKQDDYCESDDCPLSPFPLNILQHLLLPGLGQGQDMAPMQSTYNNTFPRMRLFSHTGETNKGKHFRL